MAASENNSDNGPVSFTDTNAETGMTGKGAGNSSNMMDLVSQLKKKKKEETQQSNGKSHDDGGTKSERGKKKKSKKKKNKKKKGKKDKIKYKRRHDRYEPENYLLRIEGSICCGALISTVLFCLYNALVLLIIIIWTEGDMNHLHNKEQI